MVKLSNKTLLYAGGALLLLGAALALREIPTDGIPERWAMLRQLHPVAKRRFLTIFQRIEAITGYEVVLTSVHRTDTLSSYHFFGLATDFNLKKGDVWVRMKDSKATWEATGVPALLRAAGFRWGGDFTSPRNGGLPGYDPVHADLGNHYLMSELTAQAGLLAYPKPATTIDGRTLGLAA